MKLLLFIINIINLINAAYIPQIGNIYNKQLVFPLIGRQLIETEIISNTLLEVRLSGLVNDNGSAKYTIKDNNIEIELSDNLKELMKKKRSEFKFSHYDIDKDIVFINLFIKLIYFKKTISLTRSN
tara:strand:+ start:96 stop:473 length:378 start_codon:yes stop_codon:yes gene_type:complete